MKWLLLILGILTNAGASVIVKWAASTPIQLNQPFAPGNIKVAVALCLYFGAFIFYSMAVQRLPLAVAHPVMPAGAIVLVGMSAVFVFSEKIVPLQAIGYALLLAGILCIAFSRQGTA